MLQIKWSNTQQEPDLERDDNFVSREWIDTAALISLFTRRRAEDDDELPDPKSDKGGWWADAYSSVEGDLIGSRLWLLSRSKLSQSVLNQARDYITEAIQWMVDDGLCESVEVTTERYEDSPDTMAIKVQPTKPSKVLGKWVGIWQAHMERL
jgi:phage gp46-like protein